MTLKDLMLDVRGLPAPEPLEQCLDMLDALQPGQRLQVLLDREPFPLYTILERAGFQHECRFEDPDYRVTLWHD